MSRRIFLFPIAIAFAACGGNVVVDALASTTGGAFATGIGGASETTSGSGLGGATACLDAGIGDLSVVPIAFKTCTSVADCTMHDVQFCCGSLAIGVANAESAAYETYAATCFHPPLCNCAGPLRAEDGKTGNVQLGCLGGLCMSYVP